MLADLHLHSHYSDGVYSPAETIKRSGADILALCDHDTVDGVREFLDAAAEYGKKALPCVEVSTYYGEELHLLGYNIDINNRELLDSFKLINRHRNERNGLMLEKLRKHGMPLTIEEVEQNAKSTVNRLHIGNAMIKRGYVADFKEALAKYIGDGKCCFSPNFNLEVRDGIEIIKAAGGIPVLAHPGRCHAKNNDLKELIEQLVSYGIMGIEVYYPKHSEILIRKLENICNDYNLIATAGSDRHGYPGEAEYSRALSAKTLEVLRII